MPEHKPRSRMWVDPGFVHHRKIETVLGAQGSALVTQEIEKIPASTPDWRRSVLIDHIYSRVLLEFMAQVGIKTLEQVLAEQRGQMFCSIVRVGGEKSVYSADRVQLRCDHACQEGMTVELHLSTGRIASDTLRSGLAEGGEFAVVAQLAGRQEATLVFHPLLIGYPYLLEPESGDLQWEPYDDYYRVYAEQFDEFSLAAQQPLPETFEEMRSIPERRVKMAFARLLRDSAPNDWGGETSDFVTSHLHLSGSRVSAAFLLKGPAKFSPMTLSHLGKNSDQIVRLAHEPVDVLVVQHCHEILSPVVETLKVFATQPSRPRRYCLIDGRETLRILRVYGLLAEPHPA